MLTLAEYMCAYVIRKRHCQGPLSLAYKNRCSPSHVIPDYVNSKGGQNTVACTWRRQRGPNFCLVKVLLPLSVDNVMFRNAVLRMEGSYM